MNADEIVKELRESCTGNEFAPPMVTNRELTEAADLIESLQAQLEQANKRIETKETLLRLQETTMSMLSSDKDMLIHKLRDAESNLATSQRRAQDARNELCLKCGEYKEAHNGACDGCRWKEAQHE